MKQKLKIDWCSHEAAKYSVEKWHYSKTLPRGKLAKLGVWENDVFTGSVIFSMGASARAHRQYNLEQFECCELTRIALRDHQTPVSRIGSISLKMLKSLCPKLRLVSSFADPYHGHHGGIYKAMGWIYCGLSARTRVFVDQSGKVCHARNIADEESRSADGWGTRKHSKEGMRKEMRPGKHKYLWPLDDELRKQLEPLRQEYPKSVGSADSGTHGDQL